MDTTNAVALAVGGVALVGAAAAAYAVRRARASSRPLLRLTRLAAQLCAPSSDGTTRYAIPEASSLAPGRMKEVTVDVGGVKKNLLLIRVSVLHRRARPPRAARRRLTPAALPALARRPPRASSGQRVPSAR